jgi:hypothetical protein
VGRPNPNGPLQIESEKAETDAVPEVITDARLLGEAALLEQRPADGELLGVGEFHEHTARAAAGEVGDEGVDEHTGDAVAAGVGGDGHPVHLAGAIGAGDLAVDRDADDLVVGGGDQAGGFRGVRVCQRARHGSARGFGVEGVAEGVRQERADRGLVVLDERPDRDGRLAQMCNAWPLTAKAASRVASANVG